MKNNSGFKNRYHTFFDRVLMKIVISLLFLLLCIVFISISSSLNVDSNLKYYQNSKLDYTVNLKDNNYYDTKSLGKDMQYIASLIDSIDVNFDYNFKTSDKLDYKYTYYVDAEIKVTGDNSDAVIYSKKENVIGEKTESKNNSDNFKIDQDLKIDYNKYNDIVKGFKTEYAINAKSNLILTLYVKVTDINGNELKKINANDSMKLTIPLSEQMVNVKMDYKEVNNSNTIKTYTDFKIKNKPLFSFGILFGIAFVIALVNLIVFLRKLSNKKTPYDKMLSKLLREYDRVIVEVKKNVIIGPEQNIIDVKSFEELLDARDNLEKPILFNEIHKGQKCEFIVKNSYEVYRYVLKLTDLENDK